MDLSSGVAAAVGVIPAAVVPLPPRRRGRLAIVLLGALMGVAVLLGSVLATTPWLAVVGIFALAVGVTALAARHRQAMILLLLGLPLVGVGLSYPGLAAAVPLALLFVAGSAYACAVAMCWPERPAPPAPAAAEGVPPTLGYGVRLGLAAAICARIGFALHFDHVGRATAAALLVMRPEAGVLTLRAVGRPGLGRRRCGRRHRAAHVAGARLADRRGRRPRRHRGDGHARKPLVRHPAFTTFMVFLLLLVADPKQAPDRFGERLGETLLGVGVALVFGLLVPLVARRVRPARG